MNRSILISSVLHLILIILTAMSLPFLAKKPIDLPPIVSVELIQITNKTNIPFAPKAKKTIEKIKEKEKKLVSEQAPPKKVKKIKPDSVPMPDDKMKKVEKIKDDKQNPEKIDNKVKQVSEFEKKELFDPNSIAALIDKSKVETAQKVNDLYNSVITAGTHLASSIKVAEAAKVIENSQRDINIAFVNELSKIFNLMEIDTREVLKAASTKWNFLNFEPFQ